MDSAALAVLAQFGKNLVGPDGETLDSIQAERRQQKERMNALRVRADEAHRSITRLEAALAGLSDPTNQSGNPVDIDVQLANAILAEVMEALEASDDPDAFVAELEQRVQQLRGECETAREQWSEWQSWLARR